MVLVTFGYKRLTFFLKAVMTLYVTTFLIGGGLIGAHYFSQYDDSLTEELLLASVKGFGDPISWLFVLLGFPIAWHFSQKNIQMMEMTKIQYDQVVYVQVVIDKETYSFKGLIDSGNQLYDPMSRLPVMFVSINRQTDLFPEHIQKLAADPEALIMASEELPNEWQGRLRIVPYSVVGQEHQLLAAVRPDKIIIQHQDTEYVCSKGLVSFTMQQLSRDDTFECIVHPKMLTGLGNQADSEKVS